MKNAVVAMLCTSRSRPQTRICHSPRTPRASSRPRSGAVAAWVSGIPNRAGPMIATVSSIAATLAPKPCRAPRRSATRASATPPARAIQNPPAGLAREARNETVATWAGPAGGGCTPPKLANAAERLRGRGGLLVAAGGHAGRPRRPEAGQLAHDHALAQQPLRQSGAVVLGHIGI